MSNSEHTPRCEAIEGWPNSRSTGLRMERPPNELGPTFAEILASPKPMRKLRPGETLEELGGHPVIIPASSPEISVMVHRDEAAYLESSGRCSKCGHLDVLHSLSCIPGCRC